MKTQKMAGVLAALAVGVVAAPTLASDYSNATDSQNATSSQKSGRDRDPAASHHMVRDAEGTIAAFRQADPTLSRFFDEAVGYAVFPGVGKGAFGIGGAYGRGVLFEHGQATGLASLTQLTVGAQLGGQAYSEIVFFNSEEAVASFKKGQLAMAAQVSAVVAASGASANARYAQGVAVFTLPKGGLMAEASVGGQKFGFRPFAKTM
jgi:lipid-binding SYLF domain-containing protein